MTQRTTINDPWPPMPNGLYWSPLTITDNSWPPMTQRTTINHPWPPMASIDHHWPPMTTIDYHWPSLTTIDHHWWPLNTTDHYWSPWITTDHHGPPQTTIFYDAHSQFADWLQLSNISLDPLCTGLSSVTWVPPDDLMRILHGQYELPGDLIFW